LQSIRSGKYKYIEAPKPELFDTDQDPHELRNMADQNPAMVHKMQDELAKLVARSAGASSGEERVRSTKDADVQKKLQSLGYVANSRTRPASKQPTGSTLPDPKDKIAIYEKFQRALLASGKGDLTSAVKELNSVVEFDPEFTDARILLGLTQRRQGRHELALTSFAEANKRRPNHPPALYNLALSYLYLGRVDEAEAYLKKVLEGEPTHSDAHADLGGIYHSKGRIEEAIQEYQACLRVDPFNYDALNNLASIHLARDADSEAVVLLEKLVKASPGRFEAHNNLGSAYLKLKKFDLALAEFEKALELNPRYGPVQANIGIVYMAQGRIEEAKEQFARTLEIDPQERSAREYLRIIQAESGVRKQ
jgi:tetratricopeptide (TPR) repeat protein